MQVGREVAETARGTVELPQLDGVVLGSLSIRPIGQAASPEAPISTRSSIVTLAGEMDIRLATEPPNSGLWGID
jgi:hypothetical protein